MCQMYEKETWSFMYFSLNVTVSERVCEWHQLVVSSLLPNHGFRSAIFDIEEVAGWHAASALVACVLLFVFLNNIWIF